MYSALKWGASQTGPQGIENPHQEVEIYQLNIIENLGENQYLLDIHCSKAYMHPYPSDIGDILAAARCSTLRRTMSAGFNIKTAYRFTNSNKTE